MKTQVTLSQIESIDNGRIGAAFTQALKRVTQDLCDRPGDTSARKVVLEVSAKPVMGESGACDDAEVEFQIKDTVPARRSKVFRMEPKPSGALLLNDLSPTNPHQRTLDEA